jgi:hypothetical protein
MYLQNSQLTFNPYLSFKIGSSHKDAYKDISRDNNYNHDYAQQNKQNLASVDSLAYMNRESISYPYNNDPNRVNKNVYNSNFDSNANECYDLAKLKEIEKYQEFLEEKRNKKQSTPKSIDDTRAYK